jgi:hypothetical protein
MAQRCAPDGSVNSISPDLRRTRRQETAAPGTASSTPPDNAVPGAASCQVIALKGTNP